MYLEIWQVHKISEEDLKRWGMVNGLYLVKSLDNNYLWNVSNNRPWQTSQVSAEGYAEQLNKEDTSLPNGACIYIS